MGEKKKENKAEAMVDLRGRCEREGRVKQNPMNCIKRTNIQHFKGGKKRHQCGSLFYQHD